ncbi:MAG: hypothetical protein NT168_03740 [Planctomycetota bacterium]|jgi:hypothetical protein|nr:hypothetical protein [Planctomycetota bacterium]
MTSNDQYKRFREFPLSVRIAQRSWITAVTIPLVMLQVIARMKVPWVAQSIFGISGLFALVGYVSTCWVLVRYPYIGMVDSSDGDLYSKYVGPLGRVPKILGTCAVVCLCIALIALSQKGKLTGIEILWILYCGSTLLFLLFILFRFNRLDHPAVATLLRCTLGFGIPLFPLFVPALLVGSQRAKRLLDEAQEQIR